MNGRGDGIDLNDIRTLFGVGTAVGLSDDQFLERFTRRGRLGRVHLRRLGREARSDGALLLP